ncbi:MAG: hypothetical protein K6G79_02010 [Bacteroidales bacterium]|nr:hypothetical protein [Bacteroidales bacterium]
MELNRLNHQDEDITGQVEFNRRVKYVDFRPNYGAEPIRLRASDQEERIYPFSFKCGMVPDLLFVGLEAQSVNNDGLTFQDDSIALPLWDRREIIEGFIIHTWLSADETYIWATTVNPNRVCKIDTRSLEVVKRFDLPFGPGDLAYSYANDRLYVIDKDNSRVVVIRPDNGKSVKTIRVTDNPFDDPDPICTPYRILFADNGYGILTLYDESSRYRWRIIDSREDDRLSVHPDCMQHFADGVEAFSYDAIDNWELCDLDLDHTRTRIIAGPPMERKYMHFFNSVDNTHESVLTPYRIMRFDSSREKDAVLLMLIDGMTVLNRESGTLTPKSNYGDSSYFPYDFAADFCYGLAGDDIRTYLISEGWVFTMDNTHCAPLFKAGGKEVGFNRLIAFRTGDRLLLIRNAFASGTGLIEFDAERFAPGD